MVSVSLDGVTKLFGETAAVDGVTLELKGGELFFLLGPSGCGKTTCLRIVAGFYRPDAGRVRFDERVMDTVAPHLRNTGMVFQNYALWPHMTVADNVAYGLRLRKLVSLTATWPSMHREIRRTGSILVSGENRLARSAALHIR